MRKSMILVCMTFLWSSIAFGISEDNYRETFESEVLP